MRRSSWWWRTVRFRRPGLHASVTRIASSPSDSTDVRIVLGCDRHLIWSSCTPTIRPGSARSDPAATSEMASRSNTTAAARTPLTIAIVRRARRDHPGSERGHGPAQRVLRRAPEGVIGAGCVEPALEADRRLERDRERLRLRQLLVLDDEA